MRNTKLDQSRHMPSKNVETARREKMREYPKGTARTQSAMISGRRQLGLQ